VIEIPPGAAGDAEADNQADQAGDQCPPGRKVFRHFHAWMSSFPRRRPARDRSEASAAKL
jgi:hypothetical protein